MAETNIEWTDAVWNPARGCSRVSEGCRNCYAERQAVRALSARRGGFVKSTPTGPRWTGKVELVESRLLDPLRWKKPRRVFVNSMSDLFHESLSDEAIALVFAVMALARWHTFQVLTKRPERMAAWFARNAGGGTGPMMQTYVGTRIHELLHGGQHDRSRLVNGGMLKRMEADFYGPSGRRRDAFGELFFAWQQAPTWPLPNVWLGTSVEDQDNANVRVPHLLNTPAAVRFVSAEPLLASTFLSPWLYAGAREDGAAVGWVIVGGESGPGARPCDERWVRFIVGQGKDAGVPCFVKQLGSVWAAGEQIRMSRAVGADLRFNRKGGEPWEWPADLRVREFPEARP